jgi:hypothetical protein
MAEPLKCLLQEAGMLDTDEGYRNCQQSAPGTKTVWYFQHGDFRSDNPDGMAMRETELPFVSLGSQDVPS